MALDRACFDHCRPGAAAGMCAGFVAGGIYALINCVVDGDTAYSSMCLKMREAGLSFCCMGALIGVIATVFNEC